MIFVIPQSIIRDRCCYWQCKRKLVTSNELIKQIILEAGILRRPYYLKLIVRRVLFNRARLTEPIRGSANRASHVDRTDRCFIYVNEFRLLFSALFVSSALHEHFSMISYYLEKLAFVFYHYGSYRLQKADCHTLRLMALISEENQFRDT